MSDLDPAVAVVEFGSIAAGIAAGDAVVKAAPVGSLYAGTVHPGRYLVLISGDTASVEEGLEAAFAAAGTAVVDQLFLPDIHPAVAAGVAADAPAASFAGEALGIIETDSVAGVVRAADAALKAAAVELGALRLADGLGGKGYALFHGPVAEVEAAVDAAIDRAGTALVHGRVIAQLHAEMADNLTRELRFLGRVARRSDERSR